jgi:hypothetical protein
MDGTEGFRYQKCSQGTTTNPEWYQLPSSRSYEAREHGRSNVSVGFRAAERRIADRAMAASSTRSLAVGQRLHHLKVFFSNRFVYAQVTRKTDGHVRTLSRVHRPSLAVPFFRGPA